ncbi:MAG: flagellar assembly protein T N-terminal domain-containing protein, partial [Burkholderiaceae bacterium]
MKDFMRRFILILGVWLGLAGAVQAAEVTASGAATIYSNNTSSARNQALQNALRQAVEQGVGTFIDSQTLARNYEVIRDEIYSTSQGYVT